MSHYRQIELELDHRFDPFSRRHFLNGFQSVLHCHHYSTLYTQLAIDAQETDLLREVAEDAFVDMLSAYFEDYDITETEERIQIAEQYFAAVGLGKMEVVYLGDDSGKVVLHRAHVDEGWIKKWGKFDRPVNYIAAGYVAAMFAAVNEKAPRSYKVTEVESLVMGAPKSVFNVVQK